MALTLQKVASGAVLEAMLLVVTSDVRRGPVSIALDLAAQLQGVHRARGWSR